MIRRNGTVAEPCAPPPFRIPVLVAVGIVVLIFAVVAGNLRYVPTASAYHETRYNLCTRTPEITALILTELRDDWGADNSDTRYDAASGFGCASGQSAVISGANLSAHTDWTTNGTALVVGSQVTSIKRGDFAGLNVTYLHFVQSNIVEVPAFALEGVTLTSLLIDRAAALERFHPNALRGFMVNPSWFQLRIVGQSKLTHERDSIPPTIFDPIGEQGIDSVNHNVGYFSLAGPLLTHYNTRWFAPLFRTGRSASESIQLFSDDSSNTNGQGGRGIIDTYFYDDGDGRFTDGTETTPGEVSVTSTTYPKASLGTAISNEMKRWADAETTGTTFTIGAASGNTGILADASTIRNFAWNDGTPADGERPLQVRSTHWGSVDLCARTPAVRDKIIAELRSTQTRRNIYGSATDHSGGNYAVTSHFDCTVGDANDSAIVTKANLTAHTDWDSDGAGSLSFASAGLAKLRFDDFRYLDAEYITFGGGNTIPVLPDGIFSGLDLKTLRMNGTGLTTLQSRLFEGIAPTNTLQILGIADNPRLNDVNIAPDVFDGLTDLRFIALDSGSIGRVNTRWFEKLTEFGNGGSWYGLGLEGNPVVSHYYNDTGGYYDTGATDKVDYDPSSSADGTALQQAVSAKIAAYATANTLTDNSDLATAGKFRLPDGLGVDPCGRNAAVWKELMRNFGFIDDVIADEAGINAQWITNHEVGNIRHERYANITQAECSVLAAEWVNPSTGVAAADQSSPAAGAELAIKNIGWFILDGSDLSTLVPSDLANLHNVHTVGMRSARLENVSATLFADMPKLRSLNLRNNKIKTSDLSGGTNFLSSLNNLEGLNLAGNLLTRFESSWLTSSARSSLTDLEISNNPIATMDLSGLNLTNLYIANTSIIELDPAITAMTNLRTFYWWGLQALPIDGFDSFVNGLPSGLTVSVPHDQFGNPGDLEDPELDQATLAFSLAHNAKIAAINSAGGGDQITRMQLADPCRPTIDSGTIADWESAFGDLCLTSGQKDAFISSIDNFDAASHWILKNSDFSDAQMATMLAKLAAQDSVTGIQFNGNPEAFGAGFDNSALSVFTEFNNLWLIRMRNHDLNYTQINTILRNLEQAQATRAYTGNRNGIPFNARGGLRQLDLGYNPNLFKKPDPTDPTMMVDIEPEDAADGLHNLLRGVFSSNEQAGLRLDLQNTGISFDQLRAVLWSITDSVSTRANATSSPWSLRTLVLGDNPNLWQRRDNAGAWVDVPASEITALLDDLAGIKNIYIGNTGITSQTTLEAVFDGLNVAPNIDKRIDPRDTSALERLRDLSLSGNDLSAITAAELETEFDKFASRVALQSPQLEDLGLGGTGINLLQLTSIVNGLQTADLLDGVVDLDLSNNPALFEGCDSGTALETLLARFTNLRILDVQNSDLSLDEFKCAVNGLTPDNTVAINARDNTDLFEGEDPTEVGELLGPFTAARTNLVNTGLTATQATEIATKRAENAESDAERRELERIAAAQNPAFGFKTPLPDDASLQSGRGSLRVAFTHNPMYQGASFTVLRYEYRYRLRPTDSTTEWGTSGTEAWRTASLDLTDPGEKSFDIFGLETETVYQVQLRATSVARANVLTLTGGTSINLPEISSIKPTITEINMRAGEQVRLEVDIFGLADILDNALYGKTGSKLFFTWSDDSSGGSFAEPNDQRRVTYTAPGLPGTYRIMAEAGPDGICKDHHNTNFGISDADRADCRATITVRVSRAATPGEPATEPINPAGPIPTSLSDSAGANYDVFTPVNGGTFAGAGIRVTAAKGAVPDRQLIGVRADASEVQPPAPTPGARMSISGTLFDISAVDASGQSVDRFALDDPLTACMPLPEAFRSNISDVVMVERKGDGSYGILSSKLRQAGGDLHVCGQVSTLPTTIGVAKLGVVPEPPAPVAPVNGVPEPPETGATAPSYTLALLALIAGVLLLTGMRGIRRIRQDYL